MVRSLWGMVLLAIAGLLLGMYHNQRTQYGGTSPVAASVRGIIIPLQKGVYALSSGIGEYFTSLVSAHQAISERSQLIATNAQLRRELERLEALKAENESMRGLLKMRAELPHEWLGCRVIARYPPQQTLILDRGTHHGILPGAPVVCAEGLVGVVEQADSESAIVRLLTASRVAVGARVLNPNKISSGVCEGRGESELLVNMLPPSAPVQPGDRVVSAGLGGKYPPNIPIGVVERVWVDPQYSVKKAWVQPIVDLENLQIVLVLRKERKP